MFHLSGTLGIEMSFRYFYLSRIIKEPPYFPDWFWWNFFLSHPWKGVG